MQADVTVQATGWLEFKQWLVREYEAGASVLALHQRHGLSQQSISRILRGAGVTLRSNGGAKKVISPELRRVVEAYGRVGLTPKEIAAKQVGLGPVLIRGILVEAGLYVMRPSPLLWSPCEVAAIADAPTKDEAVAWYRERFPKSKRTDGSIVSRFHKHQRQRRKAGDARA